MWRKWQEQGRGASKVDMKDCALWEIGIASDTIYSPGF